MHFPHVYGHHFDPLPHHCCYSVIQLCSTLCDPMVCSRPGFSVLHYLLGFAQTHVHWVSDAIQPSHSLPPSSSPTFCLSQHQGLFQWVTPSHQVAKVLELQLQHRLQFYSMFGCTCLGYTVWSVCIHLQTSIKKITQSVLSQYVNHGDFTRKFP